MITAAELSRITVAEASCISPLDIQRTVGGAACPHYWAFGTMAPSRISERLRLVRAAGVARTEEK